jgi:hypothetical protein
MKTEVVEFKPFMAEVPISRQDFAVISMKQQLLNGILPMSTRMEVSESKQVSLNRAHGQRETGAPPMQVSPIMLMKTNGVKMPVSGLAIMCMKTKHLKVYAFMFMKISRLGVSEAGRGETARTPCLGSTPKTKASGLRTSDLGRRTLRWHQCNCPIW